MEAVGIWLQVWLQCLSSIVIMVPQSFLRDLGRRPHKAEARPQRRRVRRLLAFALTYAPQLTDNVNNVLRSFMTVETNMVSVERLFRTST